MTEISTAERPLVTFALFAYNQEKYIREAVEGAFSQTYEPLEIILSDDCSPDRTYEIMQEMAAAYSGPHKIVIRQSPENNGLASHINAVFDLSTGSIIVMAAGDDISCAGRVDAIMEVFMRYPQAAAVHSGYEGFYDQGSLIIDKALSSIDDHITRQYEWEHILGAGGIGLGATYAYRRQVFLWPERMTSALSHEDRVLPIRAAFLGGVHYLDIKTVLYRLKSIPPGGRSANTNLAIFGAHYWDHVRFTLRHARGSGYIGSGRELLLKALSFYLQVGASVRKRMTFFPRYVHGFVWRVFVFPVKVVMKLIH